MRRRHPDWHGAAGSQAFPPAFRYATKALRMRLCDRVLAKVDEDGAVREPCRSRVLESALMLRLIRRIGLALPEEGGLVGYLSTQRGRGSQFDNLLVDCALDGPRDAGAAADEILRGVPSAVRPRKAVFLDALLTLFEVPRRATVGDEAATTRHLHTWASLEMVAVHVILAQAASPARTQRLLTVAEGDGVWDGNVLVHLLVLHALAFLPVDRDIVAAGIITVLRYQRPNGGMPFVANTDTWCTVTGGLALLSAGASRRELSAMGDFLEGQTRADCLWSYSQLTRQTDLDDSSVCLELLDSLDRSRYRATIESGLRSVAATQGSDGGFPTYVKGASSEAYVTAGAINALSLDSTRYIDHMRQAIEFLVASQLEDGTFESDWSRSRFHAIFRVLLAVSRLPAGAVTPEVINMEKRAVRAVLAARNRDAGWGQQGGDASDATSTAYALIALTGYAPAQVIVDGVDYLRRQFPEGAPGVTSIPDMFGPRPFLIDVPVLADIYVLLALGHLRPQASLPAVCAPPGSKSDWAETSCCASRL